MQMLTIASLIKCGKVKMKAPFIKFAKEIFNARLFKRPAIRHCLDNDLFGNIFCEISSNSLREKFNLPKSSYSTQLNQDLFALIINRFNPGFYVEIGANDGFTLSNTVYLEEKFGWSGILVEPNPRYINSLAKRSNSLVINKAISSKAVGETLEFFDAGLYGGLLEGMDRTHEEHVKGAKIIRVECSTLGEILDQSQAPNVIDFISVDVEGGELDIVFQMIGLKRRFKCGVIEYNNRISDLVEIKKLLKSSGYLPVWEGTTHQDLFFIDSYYLE